MKYAIKLAHLAPLDVEDDILRGTVASPCTVCGEPTEFVEICSEARFCSEECCNSWYERYWDAVRESWEDDLLEPDFEY